MTAMPYRDRVVDLATDLMGFRTTADRPDEMDACMDRIAGFLRDAGVAVNRHRFDGNPSLVAMVDGSKTPTVMLHGHIDVVPGTEQLFTPSIKENKLQGRGAADMKGGLACMLHVVADLATLEEPPSVGLMVVSDEETGGLSGARALLEEGYRPEFCITGEPNNLDGYLDIIIKQKGIINLELTARGVSAHAATPENGENAIEKLLAAYPEIKAVFEQRDEDWGTTVNYGKISGGDALNQLPDKATLTLDVRYPDLDARDEILTGLQNIDSIEVRSLGQGLPVNTDPNNRFVKALKRHADMEVNREVAFAHKPHASDLRHFAQHDIPGVAFGPNAYGSHEPFEHLLMDSIDEYCRTLYSFGASIAEVDPSQTVSSQ